MKAIHIFGDSHVDTLCEGNRLLQSYLNDALLKIDFYCRHGLNWRHFSIRQNATVIHCSSNHFSDKPMDYTVDKPDDIYVFSAPFHSAPIYTNPAWREFCPWPCVGAHPELHAISDALIENKIEPLIRKPLDLLRRMKECSYMVLVAEAPRPLCRTVTKDKVASDVIAGVDKVYRSYVARKLAEISVPIIRVPESTHHDGLTKEEYSHPWANDPHHGNAEFGTMMMKQIIRTTTGVELI